MAITLTAETTNDASISVKSAHPLPFRQATKEAGYNHNVA